MMIKNEDKRRVSKHLRKKLEF